MNANKNHDPTKIGETAKESKISPYLESLLQVIWVKIQEKFVAIAQAFRFFDIQNVNFFKFVIWFIEREDI